MLHKILGSRLVCHKSIPPHRRNEENSHKSVWWGQFSISPEFFHDIEQRLTSQVAAKILAEQIALALPEPVRGPAQVRRDNDVGKRPKWMVRRQRLGVCNVERRAGNHTGLQRLH